MTNARKTFTVVLVRGNGREVKREIRHSKYAAKVLQRAWLDKYDETYEVKVL